MCLQDGYKLVRADQLLAALSAFNERRIGFRTFRTYLGCLELVARREAAERSRDEARKRPLRRFRRTELQTFLDEEQCTIVAKELRTLHAEGLLTFEEAEIALGNARQATAEERELVGSRGLGRLVPVPRRVLKFLATCTRPALAKTLVAYLLRGLSLGRSGELRHKGTVKVSWICKLCRISERAARAARAELIRVGWISRDTGSFQRKLNRDGAYFVIDVAWDRAPLRSAPLAAQKRAQIAPPNERLETPSVTVQSNNGIHFADPGDRPLAIAGAIRILKPDDFSRIGLHP